MRLNVRFSRLAWVLAACAAAAWLPSGYAQSFPTKPVRIITPFPVGGGPDGVARIVAEKLGPALGGTVVVETIFALHGARKGFGMPLPIILVTLTTSSSCGGCGGHL